MKITKKNRKLIIGVLSTVVGMIGGFFLFRLLSKRNSTTAIAPTIVATTGGGGGGTTVENNYNGGGNGNLYYPFSIQTAYLDNISYLPYSNVDDALDKNLEDSGFTNKTETIYATSMDTGNKAYQNVNGTILFPEGNYFYETTFEMLVIDQLGVMHFYNDIDKTGLNAQIINDKHS